MTEPGERVSAVPADGRPRRLDVGWFVSHRVEAPDAAMAGVQARIKAVLARQRYLDVSSIVRQPDGTYIVELMIQEPEKGELGL